MRDTVQRCPAWAVSVQEWEGREGLDSPRLPLKSTSKYVVIHLCFADNPMPFVQANGSGGLPRTSVSEHGASCWRSEKIPTLFFPLSADVLFLQPDPCPPASLREGGAEA